MSVYLERTCIFTSIINNILHICLYNNSSFLFDLLIYSFIFCFFLFFIRIKRKFFFCFPLNKNYCFFFISSIFSFFIITYYFLSTFIYISLLLFLSNRIFSFIKKEVCHINLGSPLALENFDFEII